MTGVWAGARTQAGTEAFAGAEVITWAWARAWVRAWAGNGVAFAPPVEMAFGVQVVAKTPGTALALSKTLVSTRAWAGEWTGAGTGAVPVEK